MSQQLLYAGLKHWASIHVGLDYINQYQRAAGNGQMDPTRISDLTMVQLLACTLGTLDSQLIILCGQRIVSNCTMLEVINGMIAFVRSSYILFAVCYVQIYL